MAYDHTVASYRDSQFRDINDTSRHQSNEQNNGIGFTSQPPMAAYPNQLNQQRNSHPFDAFNQAQVQPQFYPAYTGQQSNASQAFPQAPVTGHAWQQVQPSPSTPGNMQYSGYHTQMTSPEYTIPQRAGQSSYYYDYPPQGSATYAHPTKADSWYGGTPDLSSNWKSSPPHVDNETNTAQVDEGDDVYEPLLEELGIHPGDVALRMKYILLCQKMPEDLLANMDMSGPVLIILTFCILLLLAGKVHFAPVYALTSFGTIALWALINMLAKDEGVGLYQTASFIGYGLMPMIILSLVHIFTDLINPAGIILTTICVAWSAICATLTFDYAIYVPDQRLLIGYPLLLFYVTFSLLTVL